MRYYDLKERVRAASAMEEVVAETVPLPARRSPQGYKVRCPFHQDSRPSLHLYPQTESWWCYGCQRGGDVFDWVQCRDGVDFPQAVRTLAERAGLRWPQRAAEHESAARKKRAIEDVLAQAAAFYHEALMNTAHIKQSQLDRGFTEDTLRAFRVGYAGAGLLAQHLSCQGVDASLAQEAGLLWDDGRVKFRPKWATCFRPKRSKHRMTVGEDSCLTVINVPTFPRTEQAV